MNDVEEAYATRFKREARTMARLQPPGIVGVIDAGETASGLLYFVMEFIEGTDVGQMIKEKGALPSEEAIKITRTCCRHGSPRGIHQPPSLGTVGGIAGDGTRV